MTRLELSCHTFTHVDAPRHFHPEGETSDTFLTLERLVGPAGIVDLSPAIRPDMEVTAEHLEAAAPDLRRGDIALLKTRWDERESIRRREFWTTSPFLSRDACIWLRERGIVAAGFDFPQDWGIRCSVTGEPRPPSEDMVSHQELLWTGGIALIEYLCNLGVLTAPRTFAVVMPLRVPDSDGAPARVAALEGLADAG